MGAGNVAQGPKPTDEEIVVQRMQTEAPKIPEVELAFAVEFFENVRVTHEYRGLRDRVRLTDGDFAGGSILVYPRQRILVVYNPARNDVTREPLVTRVPFDNVRHWETLTLTRAFEYYANAEERQARAEAAEKRAKAVAAAEADARAKVLAEEARA